MPQKNKKLSLEEFRSQLGIAEDSQPKSQKKQFSQQQPIKKKFVKKTQGPARVDIEKRISQLERKVMEGDLDPEEEAKVLSEIERLEKKRN